MAKKVKKELTRNNGTLTEAQFWSFIRSKLRNASRWWKPITQVRNDARRPYKGSIPRVKWEYQCSVCKKWWLAKDVEVDHISPLGSLKCSNDLPLFVERLFCETDNLQLLCKGCHNNKTKKQIKSRKKD